LLGLRGTGNYLSAGIVILSFVVKYDPGQVDIVDVVIVDFVIVLEKHISNGNCAQGPLRVVMKRGPTEHMENKQYKKKQNTVVSFLLEENILDEVSIEELIRTGVDSGKSIISVLKSRNLVNQDQLTKLTAITNNIEFVNLSPDMIDPVAVRLVSFDLARQHNLIPVRIEKDKLFVAMSSPLNLSARDTITTKTGYKVVPLAATTEAVKQATSYHFNVESVTKQDIVAMRLKHSSDVESRTKKSKAQSVKITDTPIVRLVDSIIIGGIDARASDIHIEPQEPDMRVRYRVDGILLEALDVPASAQLEVISHIKILSDMDISERRMSQDGHISIHHNDKEYDLRVSTLPATGGEKIVIRILEANTGLKSLDQIVNPYSEEYKKLNSLIAIPNGMILLAGPTGSGKTTTLYSMLQKLNTPQRNIVTVEDPVEYRVSGITQVQVKPTIGRTFATELRSILRQDPDIILVGEIRDLETVEIAISAALTGHLVLSTLHTNDSFGAVSRLVDLGVPSFQVASCLLGVVAQRLVRTICAECKQSRKPTHEELALLSGDKNNEDTNSKKVLLYHGIGCGACRHTGYHGRQGVYEILGVSRTIKGMIVEGAPDDNVKATAVNEGMKTLKKQGVLQVLEGTTTIEELTRVIDMRE
jgi:type IV pilus assembly protein PilB